MLLFEVHVSHEGQMDRSEHLGYRTRFLSQFASTSAGTSISLWMQCLFAQVWPDDWMQAPEPWKLHWSRQWVRLRFHVADMHIQGMPA